MISRNRTSQVLWTPQLTYQALCESLREIRSLYRERTITRIKKKSGLLAQIQLFFFLHPLIACLLSNSVVLSVWVFIGLAINIKKSSILFQLSYIIFGYYTPIVIGFLLLRFTPKFTPDFYQIWWDTWNIFLHKMSKYGFDKQQARRIIEKALKYYKKNSNLLEIWLMLPLLSFLVQRIFENQDFQKAILSFLVTLSPINIFHNDHSGAIALLLLLSISIIYYIKYALPVAWLQNTIDRIELEKLS